MTGAAGRATRVRQGGWRPGVDAGPLRPGGEGIKATILVAGLREADERWRRTGSRGSGSGGGVPGGVGGRGSAGAGGDLHGIDMDRALVDGGVRGSGGDVGSRRALVVDPGAACAMAARGARLCAGARRGVGDCRSGVTVGGVGDPSAVGWLVPGDGGDRRHRRVLFAGVLARRRSGCAWPGDRTGVGRMGPAVAGRCDWAATAAIAVWTAAAGLMTLTMSA